MLKTCQLPLTTTPNPDSSGGVALKNVAMTNVPIWYDDHWEYTDSDALQLCAKEWIGKPVFVGGDHPNGADVQQQTSVRAADGAVVGATYADGALILEYYLFTSAVSLLTANRYTSTAYHCVERPCDIIYDNSARKINSNEDSVRITLRCAEITPLHILITDRPRAGRETRLRLNKMDKLSDLIAELVGAIDQLKSRVDEIEVKYVTMMDMTKTNSDEASEAIAEETEVGEKTNSQEQEPMDLDLLATALVDRLVDLGIAKQNTSTTGATVNFEDRWK